MAAILWSDITPIYADLSTIDVAAQTMILAYVNGTLGVAVDKFDGEEGPMTKLARVNLAAHMATMCVRGSSGGVGPIQSMSEGSVSVTYASLASWKSDDVLGTTPPGLVFLLLIGRAPQIRGFVVC